MKNKARILRILAIVLLSIVWLIANYMILYSNLDEPEDLSHDISLLWAFGSYLCVVVVIVMYQGVKRLTRNHTMNISDGQSQTQNKARSSESKRNVLLKKLQDIELELKSYEELDKTGTMTDSERGVWRELAEEHLRISRILRKET